jgi:hypothetical protein
MFVRYNKKNKLNKLTPMRKFRFLLIIAIVWAFSGTCKIFAQTTVYYGYDNSGNRTSRTITLQMTKSAKAFIVDSVKASISDKKSETFEDNLGNQKILICPNPTHGQLLVEIQGYEKETNTALYLFDLSGKQLISKSLANSSMSLDLSGYPPGIYVMKILLGNKTSEWTAIQLENDLVKN